MSYYKELDAFGPGAFPHELDVSDLNKFIGNYFDAELVRLMNDGDYEYALLQKVERDEGRR